MAKAPLKAIIFCGGVGTRMWPMSRKDFPKQFQKLVGDQSMFQSTLKRVLKTFKPEDVYISTGSEYRLYIKKQAPQIPESNYILEPKRRDSLGAVGLANLFIYQRFPTAIVAAIWGADHIVKDEKAFGNALKEAAAYSEANQKLVKIDVHPTFPSEHNGWVKIGKPLDRSRGNTVYEFIRFIEKPNEAKAKLLFKSRKYLINTGYLVWPAELMRDLFRRFQPEAYQILEKIRPTIDSTQQDSAIQQHYPNLPKTSIDYGIFEHLSKKETVVIPVDIGWVDVGTWELLFEGLADNPKKDNLTRGQVIPLETKRSIIYSNVPGKTVAVVGLDGVVVIDTEDGLLVCNLHETDKVKQLVEHLKKNKQLQKYT